jgi:hypothetical protein
VRSRLKVPHSSPHYQRMPGPGEPAVRIVLHRQMVKLNSCQRAAKQEGGVRLRYAPIPRLQFRPVHRGESTGEGYAY